MIDVTRTSDGCAHSFPNGLNDLNIPLFVVDPNADAITRNDILGWLDRRPIEFHVPGLACLSCGGAGLDYADSPNPGINAG